MGENTAVWSWPLWLRTAGEGESSRAPRPWSPIPLLSSEGRVCRFDPAAPGEGLERPRGLWFLAFLSFVVVSPGQDGRGRGSWWSSGPRRALSRCCLLASWGRLPFPALPGSVLLTLCVDVSSFGSLCVCINTSSWERVFQSV